MPSGLQTAPHPETGNLKAEAAAGALGIFGGTFTPIHNGHLRLAIELRERLGLAAVHVVPSHQPPHREGPMVSPQRRFEWVRLAVQDEFGLVADGRELRRPGPSYTFDTLSELRREHSTRPLLLLLGDDAANGFHSWHRWDEIPALAHLIFVERPYEPPAPAPALMALLRGRRAASVADLHRAEAGLWMTMSIPPLAISSTRVRGLLKAGRSVRGLVPEAVIRSFTAEDISLLSQDEEPAID